MLVCGGVYLGIKLFIEKIYYCELFDAFLKVYKCHVNPLVGEHKFYEICTTLEKGRTYVGELNYYCPSCW